MLKKAIESGVQAKWVGCDSDFGSDIKFLNSIPKGLWYFAGIKSSEQVFKIKNEDFQSLKSGSKLKRMNSSSYENDDIFTISNLANDTSTIWEKVILGEGAKGPIITEMSFHRVFLSRSKKPTGEAVWLIMRKYKDGKYKYAISNAPKDIPKIELIKAATMRWPIEQCFGDGKGYLGMDHYEHRSWPAWHRHMLFVSLGLHLLLKLRLKSPSKKKLHT